MAASKAEDRKNKRLLADLIAERILVADGAAGTGLEALQPTERDFGGEEFVGCNEMLNLHAPEIVLELHRSYLDVGVDIIETNSFNGSPIVLDEYGIADRSRELARLAAQHACEAVKRWGKGRTVFVMGSMGPGTKSLSVTGGVTFDEICDAYKTYSLGLLEGGVDMLMLETVQDTLNLKAALIGVQSAQTELDREAPIAVSVTIELGGTMLAGQTIEALYHTVSGFDLFSVGLNCATGPATMTDHLRTLSKLSRFPVSVLPNAGLPDEDGKYCDGPDLFRNVIGRFAREGFINITGGCCGTTPEHIRAVKQAVKDITPRKPLANGRFPALAGNEPMVVEDDNKPIYVGERTNTIGSRKFKRLISAGKFDEAAEIGRAQVGKGAMVLDLCTANPDRDEVPDFIGVLKPLLRKVRTPVMIDTTDSSVAIAALKTIGGKPAINSVNLEDGGRKMRSMARSAKQYGASLICGLIDDDPQSGMAVTIERKMEIARKIYHILHHEESIPDTDIIFDPLVFPAATGDANYLRSAAATVEGVRRIKEEYPNCLTILGISNVSFGLPPAGREVINSVFLHMCTKAGLDMAIVNTQRLKRYPLIPQNERELAENLLMTGDSGTIAEFTDLYRDAKIQSSADEWEGLTTEEKVSRSVIEARKTGLERNLDQLLNTMEPLAIINGPLMQGMDEVGRMFADNRLIVAEVLESAEVMKTAVDYLRPHFPPGQSARVKGRMILATVKGDVHDIGKNLVEMIMSNNGFDIINLGIKVSPETIIEAVRRYKPDIIGLSGLLVRSAQQMVHTAEDLVAAEIDIPLLVGGAALTKRFTLTKIAPAYRGPVFYAGEAMEGLTLGNRISDSEKFPQLVNEWNEQRQRLTARIKMETPAIITDESSATQPQWIETDVPTPPDLDEHVIPSIPVDDVWKFINDQMLFGKHLGVKNVRQKLQYPDDEKINKLRIQIQAVVNEAASQGIFDPRAIYRWFETTPEGESIIFTHPGGGDPMKFGFPRQKGRQNLSAVDWVRPLDRGGDHLAMFVTTAGKDTGEKAEELRKQGRLLDSLILQAVSIELAEATAEWVHQRIRAEWGIPDPPEMTVKDIFRTKYRGIRLSFGYPACPRLEDQKPLFELLQPDKIGVTLTEGFMMYPEGSVSAVVFHHPRGLYYAI